MTRQLFISNAFFKRNKTFTTFFLFLNPTSYLYNMCILTFCHKNCIFLFYHLQRNLFLVLQLTVIDITDFRSEHQQDVSENQPLEPDLNPTDVGNYIVGNEPVLAHNPLMEADVNPIDPTAHVPSNPQALPHNPLLEGHPNPMIP